MAAARVDAQCRNTMWRSQQASGKDDWGRQSAWDQSSGECQRRLKGSGSQFLLISSLRCEFQHYMSILRCYSKLLIENLLRLSSKTTFIAKQKRLTEDFVNKRKYYFYDSFLVASRVSRFPPSLTKKEIKYNWHNICEPLIISPISSARGNKCGKRVIGGIWVRPNSQWK